MEFIKKLIGPSKEEIAEEAEKKTSRRSRCPNFPDSSFKGKRSTSPNLWGYPCNDVEAWKPY